MLVRELLSEPVVTVAVDATLHEAIDTMLEADVGSAILLDSDGLLAGIVTDSDVLQAIHDRDERPSVIPVHEVGSAPLTTIEPDRTVADAVDRMVDADVAHLPVVEEFDVVGMLTLTDVALGHDRLRDEVLALSNDRASWDRE